MGVFFSSRLSCLAHRKYRGLWLHLVAQNCTPSSYPHSTQQTQEMSIPARFFFPDVLFLFLSLYFFRTSFFVLIFWLVPLYNTQHKYPCLQRDSKPQSQQASAREPHGHRVGHMFGLRVRNSVYGVMLPDDWSFWPSFLISSLNLLCVWVRKTDTQSATSKRHSNHSFSIVNNLVPVVFLLLPMVHYIVPVLL